MKRLKKVNTKGLFLLIALIISVLACAQPQGGQQGPPPLPSDKEITKMVSELADKIELTEDQETQMLSLYQKHFKQIKSNMSEGKRPERSEMEEIRSKFEEKVKAVLTEKQQVKYEEFVKQNMPDKGPRK